MSNKAVVQRFMVDGSSVENSCLRRESDQRVRQLVRAAPEDPYSTVRRLLEDARAGRISREAFKAFVRQTNSFSLVEEILNWESYQKK